MSLSMAALLSVPTFAVLPPPVQGHQFENERVVVRRGPPPRRFRSPGMDSQGPSSSTSSRRSASRTPALKSEPEMS